MTDSQQDVVDVLTTDHREALDLIAQIKTTTGKDERRDLADTLTRVHLRCAMAGGSAGKDDVARAGDVLGAG